MRESVVDGVLRINGKHVRLGQFGENEARLIERTSVQGNQGDVLHESVLLNQRAYLGDQLGGRNGDRDTGPVVDRAANTNRATPNIAIRLQCSSRVDASRRLRAVSSSL